MAGAFGIAIFGTILSNTTNANVIKISGSSFIHSFDPKVFQEFVGLIILKAQIAAYAHVFLLASGLLFIGAIAAFWIKVDKQGANIHVMVE